MIHQGIIAALLTGAVLLTLLCSVGVLVMRDPFQRLQYCTPVASIAAFLITVAVWVDDPSWGARLKMVCIAMTLFWMNAILSHATARAVRIRRFEQFEPTAEEKIPVVKEKQG